MLPKARGFHSRFPKTINPSKRKIPFKSGFKIQRGKKTNWAVPPGFHAWWLSKKKENQTRELVCKEEEGRLDRVDNHLRCNSQKRSNQGRADQYFWMQILWLNWRGVKRSRWKRCREASPFEFPASGMAYTIFRPLSLRGQLLYRAEEIRDIPALMDYSNAD